MRAAVSAIIVNYNAGELLRGCIESLLNCPLPIEIIIVDNGSCDGSPDGLPVSSRLLLIRNSENVGFAAACNIGIQAATAPVWMFLNPDCYFDPGVPNILLRFLKSDSKVGMVGGLLMNEDGTEQGGGRRAVPTPWRSLVRAFGFHRYSNRWPRVFDDFYLHKQPLPAHPIEVEAISGACMLVKHEAIKEVGLWDENYFLHCEDLDWCMRFRQRGWKILFVPEARIYHVSGACSKGKRLFVEWHKHKGMMRFYRKFFQHQYPGILMTLVATGVWLRFCLVAAYSISIRAGQALGFWRG